MRTIIYSIAYAIEESEREIKESTTIDTIHIHPYPYPYTCITRSTHRYSQKQSSFQRFDVSCGEERRTSGETVRMSLRFGNGNRDEGTGIELRPSVRGLRSAML